MLAVSPLRSSCSKDEREMEMESFSIGGDDFPEFSGGNLLDSIDFDDLFVGINDGDVLPDLEMDPHEILAEFSVSGGEEESEVMNTNTTTATSSISVLQSAHFDEKVVEDVNSRKEELVDKAAGSTTSEGSSLTHQAEDQIVSRRSVEESGSAAPSPKEVDKGNKKSSAQSKNSQGKRKVKVDWTPELHRRFVQAVEQLGVDKAVPSRILELMGIDCLTRHNIASHLQKYRSHRKHLLAREAEAASWSQRRQMYGVAVGGGGGGGGGGKKNVSPWVAPTMGFPPPMTPPMPHFRPLHVWGHPSVDHSLMHSSWPKHLSPSPPPPHPPPPPAWLPAPPPPHHHHPPPAVDPSFWHSQHQRAVPNTLTPAGPICFPPPRFPTPPVPGIPPPPMYKVDAGVAVPAAPAAPGQTLPHPPSDFHPSKESIDAAIGDVLSKPWLPLPLGLKPPSTDSVMVELQRQGVSKIPPACT